MKHIYNQLSHYFKYHCQIYVDKWRSEQLDRFKTVQHASPVLDIQVHKQNVYVMTKNTVRTYKIYQHL